MRYNKIFVIDDSSTAIFYNRDVVGDYSPESEIISFEDPCDFLEAYASTYKNESDPMLVLLDINMPQKLGYEVLEELEEQYENLDNLHVIMVTSSNLKNDIERSSRFLCVVGYIEKPLTVIKINQALHGF